MSAADLFRVSPGDTSMVPQPCPRQWGKTAASPAGAPQAERARPSMEGGRPAGAKSSRTKPLAREMPSPIVRPRVLLARESHLSDVVVAPSRALREGSRSVLTITILVALAHAVNDMYAVFLAPLLPRLMTKLDITITLAAALAMTLSLAASLLQPLMGYLADRLGRRFFVAAGPLLSGLFLSLIGWILPEGAAVGSGIVMGLAWAAGSVGVLLTGALGDVLGPQPAAMVSMPLILGAVLLTLHPGLRPYSRPAH